MPKASEFPNLRSHRWKTADGTQRVAYYFDRRKEGKPDIALGTDRDAAIEMWRQVVSGAKVIPTKANAKRLHGPTKGKRRKLPSELWEGCPEWARRMYLNAERRSLAAGRAEFISVQDFMPVVESAMGRCQITGLTLDPTPMPDGRRNPFSPSLDRIDCSKGYVTGNVRIVCLIVNQALGDWGEEPVRVMCEALMRKTASA